MLDQPGRGDPARVFYCSYPAAIPAFTRCGWRSGLLSVGLGQALVRSACGHVVVAARRIGDAQGVDTIQQLLFVVLFAADRLWQVPVSFQVAADRLGELLQRFAGVLGGVAVLPESLLEWIGQPCQAAGQCGTVGAGRDGTDDADQTPGD